MIAKGLTLADSENSKIKIFRETDEWRSYWDSFILLTAIFNALAIPVAIAFLPLWAEHRVYVVIDMLTNVIFFVDIFVIFNTSYFDKDSEEIVDRRKIAVRYFMGLFAIDFLSSVPWGQLAPNSELIRLFNTLKIVRVLRISKIINKLKVPEDIKAVSGVPNLIGFKANQNSSAGFHALFLSPPVRVCVVRHCHLRIQVDDNT